MERKNTRIRDSAKYPVDGDKLRRACMAQGTLSRLSRGIGRADSYLSCACLYGFISVKSANDLEAVYGIKKWMYVKGDMITGYNVGKSNIDTIPFTDIEDDEAHAEEAQADEVQAEESVQLEIANDDDLGKAEALIKAGLTFYFEYIRRMNKC